MVGAGGVEVYGVAVGKRLLARLALSAAVDALPPFFGGFGCPAVGAFAALLQGGGVGVGQEVLRAAFGEVQEEVAEVAFGVDGDDGDVVEGGFFEKADAEAGFAR